MIIKRYVALLEHLRAQGYEQVLIAAHSQGTVITADALRYVLQRKQLTANAVATGREPHELGDTDDQRLGELATWLRKIRVDLLTLGSPLRQLYATHFPDMYSWVLSKVEAPTNTPEEVWLGPIPSDLGLRHWSNLWGSGDYVGRALWANKDDTRTTSLALASQRYEVEVREGGDGCGATWRDMCVGSEAHTHYFDLDQRLVAAELEALLCPKPPDAAAGPE